MGLRERWRKVREKERRIDEALDKRLAPETKLLYLKNKRRSQMALTVILMMGVVCVLFVLAWATNVDKVTYILENHFGENVVVEAGDHVETPTFTALLLVAIGFAAIVLLFWGSRVYDKRVRELERQILGGEQ